jgi:hypothetical protein
MYLPLNFLGLRAMILYHIVILVLPLYSLINAPHQIFINMTQLINYNTTSIVAGPLLYYLFSSLLTSRSRNHQLINLTIHLNRPH